MASLLVLLTIAQEMQTFVLLQSKMTEAAASILNSGSIFAKIIFEVDAPPAVSKKIHPHPKSMRLLQQYPKSKAAGLFKADAGYRVYRPTIRINEA